MGILQRFSDIVSANVNALLDKAEDPGKMIDEYLRKATKDLAEVKQETAGVMAEESRTKRLVDDNAAQVAKYEALAKKALLAGNEDDARVFLSKKQELESAGAGLQTAYAAAHENAVKMRELHDKLVKDINTLNSRRQAVKAKMAVAKTQERVNKMGASADKLQSSMGAFERMEEKADRMLDEANAMSELSSQAVDEAQALEEKYRTADTNASVEDELAALKLKMGLGDDKP
ncbi:MAG: PspA/IM30 family protein [Clostridiales bacterium]|nr:PspA/IM30 family protein [Clostridiales bacterium]MDD6936221.1 PspA/IM30 family protein [Clostridiales bacterium]MDY2961150.1 PspA/IM30 family protein [Oscillospiraceae bacterium]